jgi:hypothetical protein
LGQHSTQLWAQQIARSAGQIAVPTSLPTNPLFRQVRSLEESAANTEPIPEDSHWKILQVEFNGIRQPLKVDIRTLRTALGLPQYDMLSNGIFKLSDVPSVNLHNIPDTQHNPLQDLGRRAENEDEDDD